MDSIVHAETVILANEDDPKNLLLEAVITVSYNKLNRHPFSQKPQVNSVTNVAKRGVGQGLSAIHSLYLLPRIPSRTGTTSFPWKI